VASVYRELLKQYPAKSIGIYGCSAGGILTSEAIAWFRKHDLPMPGAVGIFGAGALISSSADSNYFGTILEGLTPLPQDIKASMPYFDQPRLSMHHPLVSSVFSPDVLAHFPPTLLLTGTRDLSLSQAAFTHEQLVKAGVESDLHVSEGAVHCSYAIGVVDANVPETREAWDVIVKIFARHLGTNSAQFRPLPSRQTSRGINEVGPHWSP